MKSKWIIASLASMSIILLFSCAPNNEMYRADLAGFWAGLWHGLICIITFIISLFTDSVKVYEVNNVGRWYDFVATSQTCFRPESFALTNHSAPGPM